MNTFSEVGNGNIGASSISSRDKAKAAIGRLRNASGIQVRLALHDLVAALASYRPEQDEFEKIIAKVKEVMPTTPSGGLTLKEFKKFTARCRGAAGLPPLTVAPKRRSALRKV